MKHYFSTDKLSVAWFALAEFVIRGEKERTLTMYRLLMHSISNEAVREQLKGDILNFFNDELAIESYAKAAQLYLDNNEPVQSEVLSDFIKTLESKH